MPFALVLIGLVMIVTGAKDTYKQFGDELISDFTGPGNFTWWIASVGAVGAVGYIPQMEKLSRAFMALVIISMLISNRGVFSKLTAGLEAGPKTPETKEGTAENGLPKLGESDTFAKSIISKFDVNNFRADPGNAQANFGKALNIVGMFI
jgi:hypothetical protein